MKNIRSIGVIGVGTMGMGIAQVCATAGLDVVLFDQNASAIPQAITTISQSLEERVLKGKLTSTQKDETIARLGSVHSLSEIQTDLVIDAVVENLEIKRKLFKTLEETSTAILASNTSSLSITAIAAVLRRPENFIGIHFFNPAPQMKLVEVVVGALTNEELGLKIVEFVNKLSKIAVRVKDSPGFVVNRVARQYYVESLKILEEKVADVESVDKLMRSAGFKMGPFELMDMIGVDTNYAVTSSMFEAFHYDSKFRPSRIQEQMVKAGKWGKKSGNGFYNYENS